MSPELALSRWIRVKLIRPRDSVTFIQPETFPGRLYKRHPCVQDNVSVERESDVIYKVRNVKLFMVTVFTCHTGSEFITWLALKWREHLQHINVRHIIIIYQIKWAGNCLCFSRPTLIPYPINSTKHSFIVHIVIMIKGKNCLSALCTCICILLLRAGLYMIIQIEKILNVTSINFRHGILFQGLADIVSFENMINMHTHTKQTKI